MGLKLEDAPDTDCEVWPENWRAVVVFRTLSTQWRIAPSGHRYGLDYAVIPVTLRLIGVAKKHWGELFSALQIMEAEFLEALSE